MGTVLFTPGLHSLDGVTLPFLGVTIKTDSVIPQGTAMALVRTPGLNERWAHKVVGKGPKRHQPRGQLPPPIDHTNHKCT